MSSAAMALVHAHNWLRVPAAPVSWWTQPGLHLLYHESCEDVVAVCAVVKCSHAAASRQMRILQSHVPCRPVFLPVRASTQ